MPASFPGAIKSFTTKTDGVDDVLASHMNDVQLEVNAIETELGTTPSGSYATVKARIEAIEAIHAAIYTTNASMTVNTDTQTVINFEDVAYDPNSLVTVGAAWKFTAPVAGLYLVNTMVTLTATTAFADGETMSLRSIKNSGLHLVIANREWHSSASSNQGIHGSFMINLAATDTIAVALYQTSGGSVTLLNNGNYNWIAVARLF